MTTPLAEKLKRQILQSGPMSVAEFMALCLFDPKDGYYTTKEPFGRSGDFVTAPEISQMFGELAAIWIISAWQASGAPASFALSEIGPGRGTLIRDMLRTFRKATPGFVDAASLYMIETSPRLKAVQKRTLNPDTNRITWVERIDDLPDFPLFLIGNELFDAVPARQFTKSGGEWIERMVGLGDSENLAFIAGAGILRPADLPSDAAIQPDGTIFEISPAREALAETIAGRIAKDGGAALFFDYGHLKPGFGDTLQAVRAHKFEDVLAAPGEADLTSHVDFSALTGIVRKAGAQSALLTQGDFLLKMGLLERAGNLGREADEATRKQIEIDVERLAGSENMGKLFKTMAVFPTDMVLEPFSSG